MSSSWTVSNVGLWGRAGDLGFITSLTESKDTLRKGLFRQEGVGASTSVSTWGNGGPDSHQRTGPREVREPLPQVLAGLGSRVSHRTGPGPGP